MTDGEIVASYRQAANKKQQIGILADLTRKKVPEVIAILQQNGENIPMGAEDGDTSGQVRWTNEREAKLLALKEAGKTWQEIADEIGGTNKSVSMHYYNMTKPKHTPKKNAEVVKDTPCPVKNTEQKTSAYGFENLIAVLANGDFDRVTFENAEVAVTIRRKTSN